MDRLSLQRLAEYRANCVTKLPKDKTQRECVHPSIHPSIHPAAQPAAQPASQPASQLPSRPPQLTHHRDTFIHILSHEDVHMATHIQHNC